MIKKAKRNSPYKNLHECKETICTDTLCRWIKKRWGFLKDVTNINEFPSIEVPDCNDKCYLQKHPLQVVWEQNNLLLTLGT